MTIMTVLGPIDDDQLGITQPHEHLLINLYRTVAFPNYAAFEDEALAVEELRSFTDAGGRSIVETTTIGIGRDPDGLRRIAAASGVNIVMGTGWYREPVYPDYIARSSVNELADRLVRDIIEGADGTGIRAGVIGEIGTEVDFLGPAQERVFRAAARAQRQTGVAISTHCQRTGRLGPEQIEILLDEGVAPDRIVIGHHGDKRHVDHELGLLEHGVYVQIDHVGFRDLQPDEQRARNVKAIIDAGFGDRLLISQDVCFPHQLEWFGGLGYGHLLRRFVPMLRDAGVTEPQIETLLVANPARVLSIRT
jgi:predicted metal-dependent phosphotriesterase family hydrolase